MFHTEKNTLMFHNNDGLRKLINMISTLPILKCQRRMLTENAKHSQSLIIYNAIYNLKLYFESHLHIKVRQIPRANAQNPENASIMVHNEPSVNNHQSINGSQDEVFIKIQLLSNAMSIKSHWKPVDELLQLNGLQTILKIIRYFLEEVIFITNSGDIIKYALEIINICAVLPKVQLLLCEPLSQNNNDPQAENENVGMNILLKVAKGGFVNADAIIQKASLFIIKTCVDAPMYQENGSLICYSANGALKEKSNTNDDDVDIGQILDSIRDNHGILVLLTLMKTENPTFREKPVDIRGLACQILARLALNESVHQIIRKLPLFNGDQLQKYLTNQQTVCEHPVATCPLLNLLIPHISSEPKPRNLLCPNIAMRVAKNMHTRNEDRRLIFSRFCPKLVFCSNKMNYHYLCGEFLSKNRIAIGTNTGDIKVINTFTRQEEFSFRNKDLFITNLECSNDKKLLLSSSCMNPSTTVWAMNNNTVDLKYDLIEKYCTFSNKYQNKLLGTKDEIATIYDVETGHKIMTLVPRLSNRYKINRAAFDSTNGLVFSDGVLWDANSGKEIHKFDKLNNHINGVFHPDRPEIISNSEVWDVRKFGLLHSVSDLDQCKVKFSKTGKVMYSYAEDNYGDTIFHTSFKTYDPLNYSNINNLNVGERILDIACDEYDLELGIIQNNLFHGLVNESSFQLCNIGVPRQHQEMLENKVILDQEEEDEDDDDEEGENEVNAESFLDFLLDEDEDEFDELED